MRVRQKGGVPCSTGDFVYLTSLTTRTMYYNICTLSFFQFSMLNWGKYFNKDPSPILGAHPISYHESGNN